MMSVVLRKRSAWLVFILVAILVVTGCPAPVGPGDSAQRNFDLDAPVEPSEGAAPIVDPYDTQPQWSWTPSAGGADVFRVRINGSDWTLLPPSVHLGTYAYPNPALSVYPGLYVFEVQERDSAGNWSEITEQTTLIKVREPSFNTSVSGEIQNRQPVFAWDAYAPAQYGATGTFVFQLERNDGGGWIVIESESQSNTALLTYTIASPLPDGSYRFGVAERNTGGARSDFTYANFTVDNVPPSPPNVSASSTLYGLADSIPFTFTSNDASSGGFTWRIVDGTLETDTEVYNSGATPDPSGSYLSPPMATPSVYTIFVSDHDNAGNISAARGFTFTVEDIPSVAANFTPAGTVTNDDPVNFTVTPAGVATSANYQYRISGSAWNGVAGDAVNPWNMSIPLPSDGARTIEVRQELSPGSGTYTSPSVALAFTADSSSPANPAIVAAPPAIGGSDTVTFTVTGEPFATFDSVYSTGGPPVPGPTEIDTGGAGSVDIVLTGLADNPNYLFSVSQTDQAGNTSPGVATYSFAVDTTAPAAPVITVANPPDGTPSSTSDVTLSITFEAGTTVEWYQSGANTDSGSIPDAGSDGAETFTFTGLADGTTTIGLAVRDAAGNLSATTTYNAVLDTVPPPVPVFNGGNPTLTNNNQPTLSFTGTAGALISFQLYDGDTMSPISGELGSVVDLVNFTPSVPLADGNYTLRINETDTAGNISADASWDFEVDTTPPPTPSSVASADLQGSPGAYYVTTTTPAFTWTGSGEGGNTFEYSVDGGTTAVGTIASGDPLAAVPLGPGYDFRVREVDGAGNISPWTTGIGFEVISSGSGTITISNPASPTFTFDNEGFVLDQSASETLLVTVTVSGVTVDSYQWLINGVDQGVNAASFTVDSTDPDAFLGVNTMTLVVDVGGVPYSDDFLFTVEAP